MLSICSRIMYLKGGKQRLNQSTEDRQYKNGNRKRKLLPKK